MSSTPWVPLGITKSNSTCSSAGRSVKSTGGQSTKSTGTHSAKSLDSVKTLGRYFLSPLRLITPENPASPVEALTAHQVPAPGRPPTVPWNRQTHNMGRGDVVIVLKLPDAYVVGYNNILHVTDKFVGVKNLPAGPHFFWAHYPENPASRCGFWIMSTGINRVHVVEWHGGSEVFVQPTRAETRFQAESVHEIYHTLPRYRDATAVGPGPEQYNPAKAAANLRVWEQLTDNISESALNRIAAEQEGGWNMHACDSVTGAVRLPSRMFEDRMFSKHLFQRHELKFCFQQQPRTFAPALVGAERSLDARDSTSYVLSRVKDRNAPSEFGKTLPEEDMIGEFQFLYVHSMYTGSSACTQQWWFTVLRVIFKAHRLAIRRPRLMSGFLQAFTAQVSHSTAWVDNSMFANEPSKCHDLRLALIVYRRHLHELFKEQPKEALTPDHVACQAAFSMLETVVKSELHWDLKTSFLRRSILRAQDRQRLEEELEDLAEEDHNSPWETSFM